MSKKLTQEMISMKVKNDRIQTITHLNLWGSDLDDISILSKMPMLEVVSLSVNKIRFRFILKEIAADVEMEEISLLLIINALFRLLIIRIFPIIIFL